MSRPKTAAAEAAPTMLDAALACARGRLLPGQPCPVFPCDPRTKAPLTEHGFKDATTNEKQIREWWTQHPDALVGVPTGAASGWFVVDLDLKPDGGDGPATWAAWESEHGAVATRRHHTPSGGQHLLLRFVPGIRSVALDRLGPGIEIKGEGGYVVVPDSVMADGRRYTSSGADAPADAPPWLLSMLEEYYRRREEARRLDPPPGQRIDVAKIRAALAVTPSDSEQMWFEVGGALHRALGTENGYPLFEEWSKKSKKFEKSGSECRAKWRHLASVTDYGLGTLYMYADRADPGWRARLSAEARPHRPLRELLLDTTTWDAGLAPPPEYAVPNRIPAGETTLFWGEGGVGKSIMLLHLCAATALSPARPWLGVTPRQGPAIFVDAEDRSAIVRHRGERILQHCDAKWANVRDRLHLFSLKGEDAVLAAFSRRSSRMETTPRYRELRDMVGDIRPSIIGIASAANVFAGSELDRAQVMQFVGLLDSLAMIAGSGLVLVGHPSLTGISTGTGTSGSTQWHNACRARLYLKSPDKSTTTDLRLLEFKKNQYGPISESITLQWSDGLFLPVEGATFDAAARGATARAVFVALLRRFAGNNRRTSPSGGKNYAPKLFAEQKEATDAGCTKKELTEAMDDLLREGRIAIEDVGPPSKRIQELRLNPQRGEQEEIPF